MITMSLDARAELSAEHAGGVPIWLFTFTHAELGTPIRISSDRTIRLSIDPYILGTISRGEEFVWLPIEMTLPADDEETPPQVRVTADASDRSIFPVIRASGEPAECRIELVWSFSRYLVEFAVDHLEVVSAPYDESQVTINLSQEAFWRELWPTRRFTPTWFPGLHE